MSETALSARDLSAEHPSARWQAEENALKLSRGDLVGTLSSTQPEAGLAHLTRGGRLLTSSLFAINTPGGSLAPPNETYVRGPDHVSTHPATERFPFRVQLCWTAEELGSGALAAILTVSLQTDLLETRPGLLFEIVGQGDAIDAGSTRGWRLDAGEGPTAILVPHPTDAPETETLTREGRLGLRLSPPFLEKGVIRRCRLAAITFAGPVDESAVREAIDRFDQLPLPLTA